MSTLLNLTGGSLSLFPELKQLLNQSLGAIDLSSLLEYEDPSGDQILRNTIISSICSSSTSSDISCIITSGCQHSISLTFETLLSSVDKKISSIIIQQPCFFGAVRCCRCYLNSSIPIIPYQRYTNNSNDLMQLIQDHPKSLIYLTSNHNPQTLVSSLTKHQKELILESAQKNNCIIIEDNPYDITLFDQSCFNDDNSTLFGLALEKNYRDTVILIGGFSKVIGAGLRVGYILHGKGVEFDHALRSAKITGSIFTPTICQKVALDAISNRSYLNSLKSFLKTRRDFCIDCLEKTFSSDSSFERRISWTIPRAGVSIRLSWLPFDSNSQRSLIDICQSHGLIIENSKFSFIDNIERPFTHINFVHLSQELMEESIKKLGESFRDYYNLEPLPVIPETIKATPLRFFITSGGTAVPLDGVRILTNLSQGTTGAMIAEDLLRAGHSVTFFYSRGSKRPFSRSLTMQTDSPIDLEIARLRSVHSELESVHDRLREVEYFSFDDYLLGCQKILSEEEEKFDVAIFVAAVSDFGPKEKDETKKISSDSDLTISLGLLPKIINQVKIWVPKIFLVTFKLLVGVTIDELVEVAYSSGLKAHSDLVVANTVVPGSLLSRRQTVIVTPEKGVIPTVVANLGQDLRKIIERRISAKHWQTIVDEDEEDEEVNISESIKQLQMISSQGSLLGLWIPYSEKQQKQATTATAETTPIPDFGFIALRIPGEGNQFLITARRSCKSSSTQLSKDDIVHVVKVDFEERKLFIHASEGRRGSLNANVAAGIFALRQDVNVIVHSHVVPDVKFVTKDDFAPGTQEDFDECVGLVEKSGVSNHIIGIANHGIIAFGKNFEEILESIGKCQTYNLHSDSYDVIYQRFLASIPEFVSLVSKGITDKSIPVLDIAAGTGAVSLALATEKGFHNLTLCDSSEQMLSVASRKLEPILSHSPNSIVCPMNKLSGVFNSPTFGIVMCRQAINYNPNIDELIKVFTSVYNLLSTGGKFVFNAPNFIEARRNDYTSIKIYDYQTPDKKYCHIREANSLNRRVLSHVQHCVITKIVGEIVKRDILFDYNSFTLFTEQEFTDALNQAGFKNVVSFGKDLVSPCNSQSHSLYIVASK